MPNDDVLISGYIRRLFALEDEVLEELRYEVNRRGMPEIYINAEVGKALQVLLSAIGARKVLEIGTLGGYSAIWMARALPPAPDGRLITLENVPEHASFAREFVARAGLEDVVEVVEGDARELLPGIADREGSHSFDAVFIDADKESYGTYLDWALTLTRPGGLILADNAFRDGRVLEDEPAEEGTRQVQSLNERMAAHEGLVSTILPIRDGVTVGVVGKR